MPVMLPPGGKALDEARQDGVSGAGGGDRRMAARLRGDSGPVAVDDQDVDFGFDQFLNERRKTLHLAHRTAPLEDEILAEHIACPRHGADEGGALLTLIGDGSKGAEQANPVDPGRGLSQRFWRTAQGCSQARDDVPPPHSSTSLPMAARLRRPPPPSHAASPVGANAASTAGSCASGMNGVQLTPSAGAPHMPRGKRQEGWPSGLSSGQKNRAL
jgi:hypothetical protein